MSSEAERARFYQEHKDDPEIWGDAEEPPRRRPSRAGLSATITVRFSPEEAALIGCLARRAGTTYSEILRRALRAYGEPTQEIRSSAQNNLFLDAAASATASQSRSSVTSTGGTPRGPFTALRSRLRNANAA